jgi:sugar lactone lactonase YvrE
MTRIRIVIAMTGIAAAMVTPASARPFPDVIALPAGWQPEGIAVGKGHAFYVGSLATGAVLQGDLRTGATNPLVTPQAGRRALGLELDERGRLFVAGGPTGQAYVYDIRTGATLAVFQLAIGTGPTFVNDVVVTTDAAWFTDSNRPVLYRVPLRHNGALPGQAAVEIIPLGGEFTMAPGLNANGIDATPNGKTLVVVQTNLGKLYKVDANTGVARVIELAGGDLAFGDGLLLEGKTVYVVQNRLNRVAVVELAADLSSGTITRYLTHTALDVPTGLAKFGSSVYVVNARFGTANPGSASYSVVSLDRK